MRNLHKPLWRVIAKRRCRIIDKNLENPRQAQQAVLERIISQVGATRLGGDLGLDKNNSIRNFRRTVPVTQYAFWESYISRVLKGERSVIFNGAPVRIAQTGGTTSAPKRIPLSRQLIRSYRQFNLDMALRYMEDSGNHEIFSGKIFIVASNPDVERINGAPIGFISGIMADIAPKPLRRKFVPGIDVIRNPDMGEKIEKITLEGFRNRDKVYMTAGLTTYLMSGWVNLIEFVKEVDGRDCTISEIFPNLRVAFHGGSTYGLYLDRMRTLSGEEIDHRNVYSAAEGPIAFQYSGEAPGLAPALDAVFFEFIPKEDLTRESPNILTIDQVEPGTPYYIVLSTQGGLLRYRIGDLVEFTSKDPPLLKVLGKSSEEIDLSAEKIGVGQAASALRETCLATNARVVDFMVCPKLQRDNLDKISHEWIIEFDKSPESLDGFRHELEDQLISHNPMYGQLRDKDFALGTPLITMVPIGTFQRFAESELNYGQQKIVHMHMDRESADRVLSHARRPSN